MSIRKESTIYFLIGAFEHAHLCIGSGPISADHVGLNSFNAEWHLKKSPGALICLIWANNDVFGDWVIPFTTVAPGAAGVPHDVLLVVMKVMRALHVTEGIQTRFPVFQTFLGHFRLAGLMLPVGVAPLGKSFGFLGETTMGGAGAGPSMSCLRKRVSSLARFLISLLVLKVRIVSCPCVRSTAEARSL